MNTLPMEAEDASVSDVVTDRQRPDVQSMDAGDGDGAMDGALDVALDVPEDVPSPPLVFIDDPAPPTCVADASVCPARGNTTAYCVMGLCRYACSGAYRDCNGQVADGCELDTSSSADNCGRCGNACAASVNSTARCVMGLCALQCNSGFADCDRMPGNGCEADTQRSTMTCGTCGTVCPSAPNGAPQCSSGMCGVQCTAGFGNCDMNNANGCELDLRSDTNNCGTCGTRCAGGANATEQCSAGMCRLQCAAGFGNCDVNNANGCEAELARDPNNCGTCGTRCATLPNSTATCAANTCGSMCNPGFSDCDANSANGCEVDTRSSLANCGACGTVCTSTRPGTVAVCTAGMCRSQCSTGFSDCDSNAANGCEVDTNNSPMNCGACGAMCPSPPSAVAVCSSAVCSFRCATGFSNCDGNSANGCEVPLPACP
ncbi:MAG: hypothetical protein JNK05_11500 [Myxococcales bacterium]|nr:hypothetical protein [Myxococcales bacterium]